MDVAWDAIKAIVAARKTLPPLRISVGAFSKPIALGTGILSLLGPRGRLHMRATCPKFFEADWGRRGAQPLALTIEVTIIFDAKPITLYCELLVIHE